MRGEELAFPKQKQNKTNKQTKQTEGEELTFPNQTRENFRTDPITVT